MKFGAAILVGFAACALADELSTSAADKVNVASNADYSSQLDALTSPNGLPQPRVDKVPELYGIPWTTNKKKFAPWECEVSRNQPLKSSTRTNRRRRNFALGRCFGTARIRRTSRSARKTP
jgi:hypothetical protein